MPEKPSPAPGQVWWCDGAALGFEAHFKDRPVLIVASKGAELHVVPLSSKRHFGQETAVVYGKHVPYLTGEMKGVVPQSLRAFRGDWVGFAKWRSEQEAAAEAALRCRVFWRKIRALFRPGD